MTYEYLDELGTAAWMLRQRRCFVCQKFFHPTSNRNKYCSKACGRRGYYNEHRQEEHQYYIDNKKKYQDYFKKRRIDEKAGLLNTGGIDSYEVASD